ncbi:MAG: GC-type dockerin domain-anchored protein [Phycisphaerales bacterium]
MPVRRAGEPMDSREVDVMRGLRLVCGVAGCLAIGVSAAPLWAQATPIRSNVVADSRINLSVVDESDELVVIDEQLDTTNALGPISAPVVISSSQGLYTASSQSAATFVDSDHGQFNGSMQYEGSIGSGKIQAQSYGHSLFSSFEYDFSLASDGVFSLSGLLVNSGPSPIQFNAVVQVYAENAGGVFTGPFFSQIYTDPQFDGEVLNIQVPLTAESQTYRVQIRLSHSGVGPLDRSPLGGSLSVTWEIESESACPADINADESLNFLDVSAFLTAFAAQDPVADFNDDTMFNFLDVSAFLSAFGAGCP